MAGYCSLFHSNHTKSEGTLLHVYLNDTTPSQAPSMHLKPKKRSKPGDSCLLDDPKVKEIADNHNKTSAQILIRLQIQRNVSIIPKSVTPHRIKENFEVFDFELSQKEIETLLSFTKTHRICAPDVFKGHKDYPFKEDSLK